MTDMLRGAGDASAIHDLGYRRYDGVRIGAGGAWRALWWQGVRAMFGIGRSIKAKAVPVFVLAVTMLPVLGTLAAQAAAPGVIPVRVGQLVQSQLILFVLFAAAQAPEVLSRDQQYHVLPLILTRDVTRWSYASARVAAIMASLFVIVAAPLLLFYFGQIGAAADPRATFERMGGQVWPVLGQSVLTTLCIGGIAAALAAWTPRRAYATAAIIGAFLVAAAVSRALDDTGGLSRSSSELLDPIRSLHTQAMLFFGEKNRRMETTPPMSLWWYAVLMSTYGVVGTGLLYLRIRRVKV